MTAPVQADQPIDRPFGCQMTKRSVTKNIKIAKYTAMFSPTFAL